MCAAVPRFADASLIPSAILQLGADGDEAIRRCARKNETVLMWGKGNRVDRGGVPCVLVKIAPHARGIFDPYDDAAIVRGGGEHRSAVSRRVCPGDLPNGSSMAFECGFRSVSAVAIDVKDFDSAVRRAGCEAAAVEVELGVVHHVGMRSVDDRFWRGL